MAEGSILLVSLKLMAVAAFILANGFFVAAEFGLVSVRRTRIEQLIAEGKEAAKIVRHVIDEPDRFIAATQLGITIASLGLGWVGEGTIASLLLPLLYALPSDMIAPVAHTIASATAFATITFLHVVLGELAPKSVALQYPEETAFIVAKPTVLTENIFRPFIWLLNGTGNLIVRLVGLSAPSGHQRVHSVEELMMLVKASHEEGVLEDEQEEMLQKVFKFASRHVNEAMIPRPQIVGIEHQSTIGDLLEVFSRSSHARFPVYENDLDDIVGIVAVKDVLMALSQDPTDVGRSIDELIRPAFFVPETRPMGDLFVEMRARQIQMAIVIDEYGGTAGLVTLEEMVEEIVGRLSDELAVKPFLVETIDERTVEIDAQLRVDEVNEELDLHLPEGEDYETVAGFILYLLRYIPREGEQLRYGNLRITVTKMKGPKIERVQIRREGGNGAWRNQGN
ncbi:MAG TPA: HlyC/CorC family transporter [Anaerolineae bacterium]|nr:HlyC/CorC family transporter [Anaerolineae bacterium]